MRFKLWLNEARYPDMTSWLSPQGEFAPVMGSDHTSEAMKLIDKYPEKTSVKNRAEARDLLFKKGWMRITHLNKILFVNNPIMPPNRIQMAELKDLAIERDHIQEIVYDNDETERTIWTKGDV